MGRGLVVVVGVLALLHGSWSLPFKPGEDGSLSPGPSAAHQLRCGSCNALGDGQDLSAVCSSCERTDDPLRRESRNCRCDHCDCQSPGACNCESCACGVRPPALLVLGPDHVVVGDTHSFNATVGGRPLAVSNGILVEYSVCAAGEGCERVPSEADGSVVLRFTRPATYGVRCDVVQARGSSPAVIASEMAMVHAVERAMDLEAQDMSQAPPTCVSRDNAPFEREEFRTRDSVAVVWQTHALEKEQLPATCWLQVSGSGKNWKAAELSVTSARTIQTTSTIGGHNNKLLQDTACHVTVVCQTAAGVVSQCDDVATVVVHAGSPPPPPPPPQQRLPLAWQSIEVTWPGVVMKSTHQAQCWAEATNEITSQKHTSAPLSPPFHSPSVPSRSFSLSIPLPSSSLPLLPASDGGVRRWSVRVVCENAFGASMSKAVAMRTSQCAMLSPTLSAPLSPPSSPSALTVAYTAPVAGARVGPVVCRAEARLASQSNSSAALPSASHEFKANEVSIAERTVQAELSPLRPNAPYHVRVTCSTPVCAGDLAPFVEVTRRTGSKPGDITDLRAAVHSSHVMVQFTVPAFAPAPSSCSLSVQGSTSPQQQHRLAALTAGQHVTRTLGLSHIGEDSSVRATVVCENEWGESTGEVVVPGGSGEVVHALASLSVSEGVLQPTFNTKIHEYAMVGSGGVGIGVRAVAHDQSAPISFASSCPRSADDASGSAEVSIVAPCVLTIRVGCANKEGCTPSTYTLHAVLQPTVASPLRVVSLEASVGTLEPALDPALPFQVLTLTVPASSHKVSLTASVGGVPEAFEGDVSLDIAGHLLRSGEQSPALGLAATTTALDVRVVPPPSYFSSSSSPPSSSSSSFPALAFLSVRRCVVMVVREGEHEEQEGKGGKGGSAFLLPELSPVVLDASPQHAHSLTLDFVVPPSPVLLSGGFCALRVFDDSSASGVFRLVAPTALEGAQSPRSIHHTLGGLRAGQVLDVDAVCSHPSVPASVFSPITTVGTCQGFADVPVPRVVQRSTHSVSAEWVVPDCGASCVGATCVVHAQGEGMEIEEEHVVTRDLVGTTVHTRFPPMGSDQHLAPNQPLDIFVVCATKCEGLSQSVSPAVSTRTLSSVADEIPQPMTAAAYTTHSSVGTVHPVPSLGNGGWCEWLLIDSNGNAQRRPRVSLGSHSPSTVVVWSNLEPSTKYTAHTRCGVDDDEAMSAGHVVWTEDSLEPSLLSPALALRNGEATVQWMVPRVGTGVVECTLQSPASDLAVHVRSSVVASEVVYAEVPFPHTTACRAVREPLDALQFATAPPVLRRIRELVTQPSDVWVGDNGLVELEVDVAVDAAGTTPHVCETRVGGLQAHTAYDLHLTCSQGKRTSTVVTQAYTGCDGAPEKPAQPLAVWASVGATSLDVQWTPLQGDGVGCALVAVSNDPLAQAARVVGAAQGDAPNGHATSTLSALQPGTAYTLQVVCSSECGDSVSEATTVSTRAALAVVDAPEVIGVGATHVSVALSLPPPRFGAVCSLAVGSDTFGPFVPHHNETDWWRHDVLVSDLEEDTAFALDLTCASTHDADSTPPVVATTRAHTLSASCALASPVMDHWVVERSLEHVEFKWTVSTSGGSQHELDYQCTFGTAHVRSDVVSVPPSDTHTTSTQFQTDAFTASDEFWVHCSTQCGDREAEWRGVKARVVRPSVPVVTAAHSAVLPTPTGLDIHVTVPEFDPDAGLTSCVISVASGSEAPVTTSFDVSPSTNPPRSVVNTHVPISHQGSVWFQLSCGNVFGESASPTLRIASPVGAQATPPEIVGEAEEFAGEGEVAIRWEVPQSTATGASTNWDHCTVTAIPQMSVDAVVVDVIADVPINGVSYVSTTTGLLADRTHFVQVTCARGSTWAASNSLAIHPKSVHGVATNIQVAPLAHSLLVSFLPPCVPASLSLAPVSLSCVAMATVAAAAPGLSFSPSSERTSSAVSLPFTQCPAHPTFTHVPVTGLLSNTAYRVAVECTSDGVVQRSFPVEASTAASADLAPVTLTEVPCDSALAGVVCVVHSPATGASACGVQAARTVASASWTWGSVELAEANGKAKLGGFLPGEAVLVRAVCVLGDQHIQGPVLALNAPASPGVPLPPVVVETSTWFVRVRWLPSPHLKPRDHCDVVIREPQQAVRVFGSEWEEGAHVITTLGHVTPEVRLKAATDYLVGVKCTNEYGTSESTFVPVRTVADGLVLHAPEEDLQHKDASMVRVSWRLAPCGDAKQETSPAHCVMRAVASDETKADKTLQQSDVVTVPSLCTHEPHTTTPAIAWTATGLPPAALVAFRVECTHQGNTVITPSMHAASGRGPALPLPPRATHLPHATAVEVVWVPPEMFFYSQASCSLSYTTQQNPEPQHVATVAVQRPRHTGKATAATAGEPFTSQITSLPHTPSMRVVVACANAFGEARSEAVAVALYSPSDAQWRLDTTSTQPGTLVANWRVPHDLHMQRCALYIAPDPTDLANLKLGRALQERVVEETEWVGEWRSSVVDGLAHGVVHRVRSVCEGKDGALHSSPPSVVRIAHAAATPHHVVAHIAKQQLRVGFALPDFRPWLEDRTSCWVAVRRDDEEEPLLSQPAPTPIVRPSSQPYHLTASSPLAEGQCAWVFVQCANRFDLEGTTSQPHRICATAATPQAPLPPPTLSQPPTTPQDAPLGASSSSVSIDAALELPNGADCTVRVRNAEGREIGRSERVEGRHKQGVVNVAVEHVPVHVCVRATVVCEVDGGVMESLPSSTLCVEGVPPAPELMVQRVSPGAVTIAVDAHRFDDAANVLVEEPITACDVAIASHANPTAALETKSLHPSFNSHTILAEFANLEAERGYVVLASCTNAHGTGLASVIAVQTPHKEATTVLSQPTVTDVGATSLTVSWTVTPDLGECLVELEGMALAAHLVSSYAATSPPSSSSGAPVPSRFEFESLEPGWPYRARVVCSRGDDVQTSDWQHVVTGAGPSSEAQCDAYRTAADGFELSCVSPVFPPSPESIKDNKCVVEVAPRESSAQKQTFRHDSLPPLKRNKLDVSVGALASGGVYEVTMECSNAFGSVALSSPLVVATAADSLTLSAFSDVSATPQEELNTQVGWLVDEFLALHEPSSSSSSSSSSSAIPASALRAFLERELPSDWAAHVPSVLEVVDRDGSGTVSFDEFVVARRHDILPGTEFLDNVLSFANAVEVSDITAFTPAHLHSYLQRCGLSEHTAQEWAKRINTNADDHVTLVELGIAVAQGALPLLSDAAECRRVGVVAELTVSPPDHLKSTPLASVLTHGAPVSSVLRALGRLPDSVRTRPRVPGGARAVGNAFALGWLMPLLDAFGITDFENVRVSREAVVQFLVGHEHWHSGVAALVGALADKNGNGDVEGNEFVALAAEHSVPAWHHRALGSLDSQAHSLLVAAATGKSEAVRSTLGNLGVPASVLPPPTPNDPAPMVAFVGAVLFGSAPVEVCRAEVPALLQRDVTALAARFAEIAGDKPTISTSSLIDHVVGGGMDSELATVLCSALAVVPSSDEISFAAFARAYDLALVPAHASQTSGAERLLRHVASVFDSLFPIDSDSVHMHALAKYVARHTAGAGRSGPQVVTQAVDTDGNGVISRTEFVRGVVFGLIPLHLSAHAVPLATALEEVEHYWNVVSPPDANDNAKPLTRHSLAHHLAVSSRLSIVQARVVASAVDANQDDAISRDEWTAAAQSGVIGVPVSRALRSESVRMSRASVRAFLKSKALDKSDRDKLAAASGVREQTARVVANALQFPSVFHSAAAMSRGLLSPHTDPHSDAAVARYIATAATHFAPWTGADQRLEEGVDTDTDAITDAEVGEGEGKEKNDASNAEAVPESGDESNSDGAVEDKGEGVAEDKGDGVADEAIAENQDDANTHADHRPATKSVVGLVQDCGVPSPLSAVVAQAIARERGGVGVGQLVLEGLLPVPSLPSSVVDVVRASTLFLQMDADGDGAVSAAEHAAFLDAWGFPSSLTTFATALVAQHSAAYASPDAPPAGNGVTLAALQHVGVLRAMPDSADVVWPSVVDVGALFSELTSSAAGTTVEELRDAFESRGWPHALAHFAASALDTTNDGHISLDELVRGHVRGTALACTVHDHDQPEVHLLNSLARLHDKPSDDAIALIQDTVTNKAHAASLVWLVRHIAQHTATTTTMHGSGSVVGSVVGVLLNAGLFFYSPTPHQCFATGDMASLVRAVDEFIALTQTQPPVGNEQAAEAPVGGVSATLPALRVRFEQAAFTTATTDLLLTAIAVGMGGSAKSIGVDAFALAHRLGTLPRWGEESSIARTMERILEMFHSLDLDNSNQLGVEELARLPLLAPRLLDAVLSACDVDESDTLDLPEFVVATASNLIPLSTPSALLRPRAHQAELWLGRTQTVHAFVLRTCLRVAASGKNDAPKAGNALSCVETALRLMGLGAEEAGTVALELDANDDKSVSAEELAFGVAGGLVPFVVPAHPSAALSTASCAVDNIPRLPEQRQWGADAVCTSNFWRDLDGAWRPYDHACSQRGEDAGGGVRVACQRSACGCDE